MDKRITHDGMKVSDFDKFKELTENLSYSESPYLRLTSLFIFFDVNMDCLYNDYKDKSLYVDKYDAKRNLINVMTRSGKNYGSIDKWYKTLGEHLNKKNNFTCHKCLLDTMSKVKDSIYNDSECKIVKDYNEYTAFFEKFYISAFESLKSEDNELSQSFNELFQPFQDDWKKCLIMHEILPTYGINIPSDEIIADIAKRYIGKFEKNLFKDDVPKILGENKDEEFNKILSSIRENWEIISKICKDEFLKKKLLDLISNEETLLEELDKLEDIEKDNPFLNFNNVVKYAFLLNYKIKEKDRVQPTAISNSFSKYYRSEKETVFFCYEIIFKLLSTSDFTERIIKCFKLLFFYACTEQ